MTITIPTPSNKTLCWFFALCFVGYFAFYAGHYNGRYDAAKAYAKAKVYTESEYDSYRHQHIVTTKLHVPHKNEDKLPWLGNPKEWHERIMLAGYPEVTIVNTEPMYLPERDARGYIKGSPESKAAEEAEEAAPAPAPAPQAAPPPAQPQPQYYPPDPKSFAAM